MTIPLQIPLSSKGPDHDPIRLNSVATNQRLLDNTMVESGMQASFPIQISQFIVGFLSYEHLYPCTQQASVSCLQSPSSFTFFMAMGSLSKASLKVSLFLMLERHGGIRSSQHTNSYPRVNDDDTAPLSEPQRTIGVDHDTL